VKVIIDTNVFISGMLFPEGIPRSILLAWKNKKFRVMVSPEILEEYYDTAKDLPKRYSTHDALEFLKLAMLNSEYCQPSVLPEKVCADPDDDKFLACALASKTKIIVSGDKHLRDVSGYNGIEVLSPRQFIENYIK
jgi:putative PIN family toxin of toxin-antitoxin system